MRFTYINNVRVAWVFLFAIIMYYSCVIIN